MKLLAARGSTGERVWCGALAGESPANEFSPNELWVGWRVIRFLLHFERKYLIRHQQ
jgi:hypothetical protein